MKKKIVLIQPPFERLMGYSRFYTHPGLLSLGGVIDAAGHDVLIYDADYDPKNVSYNAEEMMDNYDKYVEELSGFSSPVWTEIKNVLQEFNPEYVGISILSATQDSAKKVIDIARNVNPDILIIAGGVHATIFPEEVQEYADFTVQYEGESAILDIIEGKVNKGIIRGTRIENLDELPLPAVHRLYDLESFAKRDISLIISSRGCPNACKFCNSPLIWERRVVRKSVNRFIEEIKILNIKFDVKDFYVSDDSFTYNRKWLNEFCNQIKDTGITWRCLARIDHIDEDMIRMMTEAGCRNIKFGIESGSQRILDMVNKRIKIEDVLKTDEMLRKQNINWSAFFMMGFPGETEEDIRKTQELIKNISARSITVSIFTPFPGNELLKIDMMDYRLYSHHSPHNNFTGIITDKRFKELVKETLILADRGYIEHTSL